MYIFTFILKVQFKIKLFNNNSKLNTFSIPYIKLLVLECRSCEITFQSRIHRSPFFPQPHSNELAESGSYEIHKKVIAQQFWHMIRCTVDVTAT